MSKLLELAERVEAATGPDRELDEAIAELMEPGLFTRDGHGRLRKNLHGTVLTPQWDLWTPPYYTASLDAAMTLVPEGHCGRFQFGPTRALIWAFCTTHENWMAGGDTNHATGSTLALALCAAALRARASIEGWENA